MPTTNLSKKFLQQVEDALFTANLGTPMVRKNGKSSLKPWVPVLRYKWKDQVWTRQVMGFAYSTKIEAYEKAVKEATRERRSLKKKLLSPKTEGEHIRNMYGLPEKLPEKVSK